VVGESGIGYVPDVALNTQSHFEIFDTSAILLESLADDDWEEKERNAIVARIARITITTISSTRVNPECFLFSSVFIRVNLNIKKNRKEKSLSV
jgi:hypothetical protein